jgi:NAD(P)-dependent dehydrogenase (short-subunit alcohol dehydrogenase family)
MRKLFPPLCVALLGAAAICPASAATVLITGSDRGLGLEFTRQYAARGDTVIATCRHPDKAPELQSLAHDKRNVVVERLDVNDDEEVKALAARYRGRPIDVLVNNAGVLGAREDQTLGTFGRKAFHEVMDVNAFGPLAVSQAFRDNVIASNGKKIVAVTSGLGSISRSGSMPNGPYYYRMSKAAMNMGLQALGADLRSQGVIVAVVSPGASDTQMFAAFTEDYRGGRKIAANTPAQSVAGMIAVIDKLDAAHATQGILNYDGTVTAW